MTLAHFYWLNSSYHLYGHIHNRFDNPACEELAKMDHAFNVGVDLHNFFPVTLDELIARRVPQGTNG